jgi:hypothetical protein
MMLYIAMALPMAPWIGPTLTFIVLLASFVVRTRFLSSELVAIISAGCVGGIMATAVGFYMPTLFFINQTLFNQWLARSWHFSACITFIVGLAGWFGMWLASLMQSHYIHTSYPFPLANVLEGIMEVERFTMQYYIFALSSIVTVVWCIAQDILMYMPSSLVVCNIAGLSCFICMPIRVTLWPLVWALGAISGKRILFPLLIGMGIYTSMLMPLHTYYFSSVSYVDFLLSFCGGLLVITIASDICTLLYKYIYTIIRLRAYIQNAYFLLKSAKPMLAEGFCITSILSISAWYCGIPLVFVGYVVLATVLATYYLVEIVAAVGIAPLGRFASMVMIPALLVYTRDPWYLTVLSVFVATATGVAGDAINNRILAYRMHTDMTIIKRYQYLGLLISALLVGIVFVTLVLHIPLGSEKLFAQKAQTRALLCALPTYNWMVLLLGALCGFVLYIFKCNSTLILTGILLSPHICLGLIAGSLLSLCFDKKYGEPVAAGICATNACWIVLRAVFGI